MPAQNAQGGAVYYVEFDTAPNLEACLRDGKGDPIDLTGSEVFISIAFAMPRGSYYTSPRDQIVTRSPVTIDPDQTEEGRRGWVAWTPGTEVGVDALTPPGQFLYQFKVKYPNGGEQTIPPDTYLPMVIKTNVGGRAYNVVTP
jgi:hypothetical protein